MKITKLYYFITLLVTSIFSMLILFGCSAPMNSLENISTVKTGKGTINALAFSPSGTQFAVASSEGLWIYDTRGNTGPVVLTKESKFRALAWSDHGLASGSDSTITLWSTETKEPQRTFNKGTEALMFTGNTWIFCVSYKYKHIDGWDVRTGSRLPDYPQSIPWPGSGIKQNGDHSIIVEAPEAFVYREKEKQGYERITQREVPSAAAFGPNGIWARALKDVVSDNQKRTVEYNRGVTVTHKGKTYNIAEKMETPATVMAFSTDGNFLATGGQTDAEIHLWNVKTRKLLQILTTQTDGVTALAFSIDGVLACGGRKGKICLWK